MWKYFVSEVYGNEGIVEIHFAEMKLNKALENIQKNMILINVGTSSFPLLSSGIGEMSFSPGRSYFKQWIIQYILMI